MNADIASLPPREAILVEPSWRVAHAFDSSLPGWLVVIPRRHIESLDELSEPEAAPLGSILRRCSAALREVTGATKCYLMFFAEGEGFSHLHIHLVPRLASFTDDQVGPSVFGFLGGPPDTRLSTHEQDRVAHDLCLALRDRM